MIYEKGNFMMDQSSFEKLSEADFRRLTGVFRPTFEKMLSILLVSYKEKHARGGRKPKLSLTCCLLMTLEYLREYRTYFHIGNAYGVSESSAYKTIRWIENTLIKEGTFSLPGKTALLEHNAKDILLIDATESPIERPKKSRKSIILARKNAIHLNPKSSSIKKQNG